MSQITQLAGGVPALESFAACSNVAAIGAAGAFAVYGGDCRYGTLLALCGRAFHFDWCRKGDFTDWHYNCDELTTVEWRSLAAALGLEIETHFDDPRADNLADYRVQITACIDAGHPFVGLTPGGCPYAVGQGYRDENGSFEVLWNAVWFANTEFLSRQRETGEEYIPGDPRNYRPSIQYSAHGTPVVFVTGRAENPRIPQSAEEKLLCALRNLQAAKADVDSTTGWAVWFGAEAMTQAAEDILAFESADTGVLERFRCYCWAMLHKLYDYRRQARRFLSELQEHLPDRMAGPAQELAACYSRQIAALVSAFQPCLDFRTTPEAESAQQQFIRDWGRNRAACAELFRFCDDPERQAQAAIDRILNAV